MIHFLGMEKAVNEMPFFPTKVQEWFFLALITKFTKVAVKLRTATFNFSTPPLTIAFLAVELSLSPPRGNFSQDITEGHLLVTYLLLSHSWHGWPFSPSIVTPGWSDFHSSSHSSLAKVDFFPFKDVCVPQNSFLSQQLAFPFFPLFSAGLMWLYWPNLWHPSWLLFWRPLGSLSLLDTFLRVNRDQSEKVT